MRVFVFRHNLGDHMSLYWVETSSIIQELLDSDNYEEVV